MVDQEYSNRDRAAALREQMGNQNRASAQVLQNRKAPAIAQHRHYSRALLITRESQLPALGSSTEQSRAPANAKVRISRPAARRSSVPLDSALRPPLPAARDARARRRANPPAGRFARKCAAVRAASASGGRALRAFAAPLGRGVGGTCLSGPQQLCWRLQNRPPVCEAHCRTTRHESGRSLPCSALPRDSKYYSLLRSNALQLRSSCSEWQPCGGRSARALPETQAPAPATQFPVMPLVLLVRPFNSLPDSDAAARRLGVPCRCCIRIGKFGGAIWPDCGGHRAAEVRTHRTRRLGKRSICWFLRLVLLRLLALLIKFF